jgi:gliding motility-associated protein GldE
MPLESEPEPIFFLGLQLLQQVPAEYGFLIWTFFIVSILLVCSALYSASENAFFSLSPNDLDELQDMKTKSSERAIQLVSEPDSAEASNKLLATILIMNNFINIAIIIISSLALHQVWDMLAVQKGIVLSSTASFFLEVVVITFVLVLLGEVIPKIYATQNNLRLVNLMATPLYVSKIALKPLIYVLTGSTAVFDRFMGNTRDNVSLEELHQAIEIASEDDNIEEKNILKGIVNFGNISVKQIMRPRIDVSALDINTPAKALFEKATEWGYSRVPIYKDSFDQIEGVLYIKDLIPLINKQESTSWQKLIRPPFFVPANKKIDDLLEEFQEKRIHMAIVVDEYGGSSGIVTMEDVLEEIFGEMVDEFDDDEVVYSKLDDNTYIFEGKAAISDLVKIFDLRNDFFEDLKGEAETLGGLIMEIHQGIPLRGEVVKIDGFELTIESADNRRIKRVKVLRDPVKSDDDDENE